MNKWLFPALTALALLNGCASVQRGSIPVVDSGTRVSNSERVTANRAVTSQVNTGSRQNQAIQQDSGVTVMVPQGSGASPIQTFPASTAPAGISTGPITPGPVTSEPFTPQSTNAGSYTMPSAPTGIPRAATSGGLSADEQLDGPVLALLTTAQQQQSGGDYNGASSSLERAQRIAPREPQVLYRLAQVRLAQGDAPQAEQLARRALTYANGRPDLQSGLWNIIAQSREKQGDAAGAALARQKAQVNL
ncbi:tetratricopeptide repeat protein [Pseudomonas huaxiensis]|uniref:tetratricopeptide repeat protein n=1 Tax=Pseudomonas huaxiensis TaxID=2213017 RepID=UPI000DA6D452|nr:tetratricopeptide repeat protein [Pseudomonas huaxiensis]